MRTKEEFKKYSSQIKAIWNRFMRNEMTQEDRSILPDAIYESWCRSRDYGLDSCQYTSYVKTRKMNNDRRKKAIIGREFINKFYIGSDSKYSFDISIFDEKLNDIAFDYTGNRSVSSARESVAGTCAPALAILKNDVAYVLGPEHYSRFFHSSYCAAAPFYKKNGDIAGVIDLNSEEYEIIADCDRLLRFLARMCSLLYQKSEMEGQSIKNLKRFIEVLPAPIVYFNDSDIILSKEAAHMLKSIPEKEAMEFLMPLKSSDRSQELYLERLGSVYAKKIGTYDEIKSFILEKRFEVKDTRNQKDKITFHHIIGNADTIKKSIAIAKKIAETDMAVLLLGESGTGKELFANAIHNASQRRKERFVALNCGAIASNLIESELFGYENGAFTDAYRKGKSGLLELASGGTLFLDEIESMPVNAQIKLLRVLSSGKMMRVGSVNEVSVDIRVIAATKVNLFKLAYDGKFRVDLYFRISTSQVTIPPLRERIEDVVDITKAFMKRNACDHFEIMPDFYECLQLYTWPGNVRELENVLYHACIFAKQHDNKVSHSCLPEYIQQYYKKAVIRQIINKNGYLDHVTTSTINDVKTDLICAALNQCSGNVAQAAALLGVDRGTIYNKAKKDVKIKNILSRQ